MTTITELEEEVRYFRDHKARLVGEFSNKYVIIKGSRVIGAFDEWLPAFEESIRLLGLESCLIKRVVAQEPIHVMPHLLIPSLRAEL